MGHAYEQIAFTPAVRAQQEAHGSAKAYAGFDQGPDHHDRLGEIEAGFIAARDSVYMASVGQAGWPYIQHRGGPPGFVKVLDDKTIGFADYRGNRQYVSVGNVGGDDRVALFLMDYPNRTRLKLFGRARLTDDSAVVVQLMDDGYRARPERAWLIEVAGFAWNCPQHITPRFTEAEVIAGVRPLQQRIMELEAEVARLKNQP